MIAFTSFPLQSDHAYNVPQKHHPDVAEDIAMDLDDEDAFESGGLKTTYPGESLTSSQAYMRWGIGFNCNKERQ